MTGIPLMFGNVVPSGGWRGKLAGRRPVRQTAIMKTPSPFAILVLSGFIGLLTGKFGLWFPLGMATAIIVAIVQNKRAG
ncbi:hypothetical protein SP5_087_00460 [Sphingomonas parapaucimobilis NBRC 15100]|uniref:Uncharacterized protein n=1 Tax=Sphingomonas parapaucimobilis NBRC 15100 TaxID=1219049 RepID=A0A0A1WAG7_9SPHN|nr:hypothetical protein SP5_087_00460 [Sphingomonas parapaucimobilis NBRC 15100]